MKQSHETRVYRTQRAGRLTDSGKTENRQEQLYLCYDRKEIVYAIRPLNQRRDLIDDFACLALVCQGQDELHCFVSTGDQPVFRETRQQRVAASRPALTQRKMKPASSSHQQIGGA